jgi:short-subunit dehydrogenase
MATENNSPKGYALITGGTSGIGYELAKCFAEDGYNLVLVARTEVDLQQCATSFTQQYKYRLLPIAKDLFHP